MPTTGREPGDREEAEVKAPPRVAIAGTRKVYVDGGKALMASALRMAARQ